MKKRNWMTIALMTLVLGAAIPAMTGCKTSEVAANGSQTVKYTCPMHPEVVLDTPGNCPICGMTLVEVINTISLTTH
jgi:Cu(I)/Ag(I) efflux system membrane fusion protein